MCASWLDPEVELLEVKMSGCCRIKLDGKGDSYGTFLQGSFGLWVLRLSQQPDGALGPQLRRIFSVK